MSAESERDAAVTLLHILVAEQRVMMETYRTMRARGERSIPSWPRDRFESNIDYVIEKTLAMFPIPSGQDKPQG